MSNTILKNILIGILFVLADVLIFQHLSLFGAYPDLVLIYVLWLCLYYERYEVLWFTAGLALLQDILLDFWGIHLFAKVLVVFFFYNFIRRYRESRLLTGQIFLLLLVIALIHNIFFIGLASFAETLAAGYSPAIFILLNSLYTSLIGTLLFIFKGS